MNLGLKLYSTAGAVEHVDLPTAVTVGVFDGVHCGHRDLIRQLASHHTPLIVSLTSHPSFVLGRRESEYWLDDPEEHLRLLFEAGAEYVAVLPFTREVASLPACALARELYGHVQMRTLLLGYDNRFGSKVHDDFPLLPDLGRELGFGVVAGNPFTLGGTAISSSRIRESLLRGDVETTASLLGRPYAVCGTVAHGRGVGHTLGFPTANVDLTHTRKMLPLDGVYTVSLRIQDAKSKRQSSRLGMANLGAAPTFGVEKPLLEVHLLDFEGDLYGQEVEVCFMRRLRDTRRFDSPQELQQQLEEDLATIRDGK
ncbi:MAG: riboflavin biosynthesis protein RibF [Bacteroidales bacterium]|nr:riboflavin biosynthesis protein RibF [Bacteroidales bacterium]